MAVISRRASYTGLDAEMDAATGHVVLAYDTDQPLTVWLTFVETYCPWSFARDVLARRIPGTHDVHVDVDGMWTVITLTTPDGSALLRVMRCQVDAFLAATARAVPYGSEVVDFDAELDQLLKDGAR